MREKKIKNAIKRGFFSTLIGTLLTAIVFVTTGCEKSPVQSAPFDYLEQLDQLVNAEAARNASMQDQGLNASPGSAIYDACDMQKIGPDGGSLNVDFGTEAIVFVVPKGALDSFVTIEICGWKEITNTGEVYVYDCQPHGLKFKTPMWVNHPVNFDDIDNSVLFYREDGTILWSLEDISKVSDRLARLDIRHFSGYGVSNYRNTGPTGP